MAHIPQTSLFDWEDDIENLGDLERLRCVLRVLPDEKLMRTLEAERGNGRDDYPVRPVWNSILAGIVFQHPTVESLRRELQRNGQLRYVCGFDMGRGAFDVVPTPRAYTEFLQNLYGHQEMIDEMFGRLVEALREELPDFGRHLAADSKAIQSHARRQNTDGDEELERDGRRDVDADVGVKTYRGRREDGTLWEKTRSWFGYKLHLIVDADYELPVAYEVTRASRPDNKPAARLVDDLEEACRKVIEDCEALAADRGYDDGKLLEKLWRGKGIKPVVDIRDGWKDGEDTRRVPGTRNVVYDCEGTVYCWGMKTGKVRQMDYWGYEKGRDCQKWRCPAAVHGRKCPDAGRCGSAGDYGKVVRIKRSVDPRVFTPIARPSLKFERLYSKRTAVERVNGRLDTSFGFEDHCIRGQAKMRLRCSLALVVMLAMALGRVREKRKDRMRSLVRAA